MGLSPEPCSTNIKAIIFAAGSDGDIHPHLGLGCELVSRGHQVLFITSLNYIEMAKDCGLEAITCLGEEEKEAFEATNAKGAAGKIKARFQFFSDNVTKICQTVASHLDDRSILIAPPFAYTIAKLLHLKYGTPYISTALAPSNILCSLKNPPSFRSTQWFSKLPYPLRSLLFRSSEQLIIDPLFRKLLKDPARRLDLVMPPPKRVISDWLYSSQRILGLFSDWFCPRPEDWPDHISTTGFPLFHPGSEVQELSDGLSRFLDSGPPPVVFTAGTDTRSPRAFFKQSLKATEILGIRGVFLTRLASQLPKLPNTIWHENYTSLLRLLPRASVLVHHGGIGTTAQAIRAGIPQLILPERMDQLDNGEHIERLGCGLMQKNQSEQLMEKLKTLLAEPKFRAACDQAQSRIELGAKACGRAADVVEETFYRANKVVALASC
jgi:rhamnosyltransferase subunit B